MDPCESRVLVPIRVRDYAGADAPFKVRRGRYRAEDLLRGASELGEPRKGAGAGICKSRRGRANGDPGAPDSEL